MNFETVNVRIRFFFSRADVRDDGKDASMSTSVDFRDREKIFTFLPGESRLRRDFFSGWSHTSDLKLGTPVATLLGAWCYRVSAGSGRPGVSIL